VLVGLVWAAAPVVTSAILTARTNRRIGFLAFGGADIAGGGRPIQAAPF
jgi:hypothetical protein